MAELSAALHGVAARSPTPRSATALAASEVSASDLKRRVLRLLEINEGMPRARISRGGGAALVMLSLLLVLPVVLPNWHIGAAAPVSVGNKKQATNEKKNEVSDKAGDKKKAIDEKPVEFNTAKKIAGPMPVAEISCTVTGPGGPLDKAKVDVNFWLGDKWVVMPLQKPARELSYTTNEHGEYTIAVPKDMQGLKNLNVSVDIHHPDVLDRSIGPVLVEDFRQGQGARTSRYSVIWPNERFSRRAFAKDGRSVESSYSPMENLPSALT
jgi:hypothetical protein